MGLDIFDSGGLEIFGNSLQGKWFIGDTSNAKMTVGLTINQGNASDEILALKASGGVAHGGTDLAETDTFATFAKVQGNAGGLKIRAFKDIGNTTGEVIIVEGYLAENTDTTKSAAGRALIELVGSQLSGTAAANVVQDGNILGVRSRATTVALIDEDGDLWLNSGGKGITLGSGASGGSDSAAVADEVSLGHYEIGAGNRVLAISQETAVAADTDETKFSHKLQARINGATYYIMLTAT